MAKSDLPPDSKLLPDDPDGPLSEAAIAVRSLHLDKAKVLGSLTGSSLKVHVTKSHDSVWAIVRITTSVNLAIRLCHDSAEIQKVICRASKSGLTITATGSLGRYDIELSALGDEKGILRCVTGMTPIRPLFLALGSRDVFPISSGPSVAPQGMVHCTQKGSQSGYVFFSLIEPGAGSALYFQDFSALSDYWNATGTEPKETVGMEWPELGFRRPVSTEKPLEGGHRYVIADLYLSLDARVPTNEYAMADQFLEALMKCYLALPRPKTKYYDWQSMAQQTLNTLARNRSCQRRVKGRLYFNAYLGSAYKPPESMVQWALLVPLLEYAKWRDKKVTVAERLASAVPTFYDPKAESVVRWLPGTKFDKDKLSEEEHAEVMDSWYLVHTVHNLGRMVEMGATEYREIYFKSVAYLMRAGDHFSHEWPVFYNVYTLAILKKESEPGAGGEQDVPGLYVGVMVQAYELSQDRSFLKEAEAAALRLKNLGMHLLYQTNNTVMAAVALAQLWKHTCNRLYLDLSRLCLSNFASRLWIWDFSAGSSKHYTTFMAVPPLHNAPYISPYEEAEVFASFGKYLELVGPELTEPLSLLISEYTRYFLHRARFYYPAELPSKLLSPNVREGHIDASLPIPLEDLYPVMQPAGQVGQEVYGAACPFIVVTRTHIRLRGMPFVFFCDYPILQHSFNKNVAGGVLVVHIGGSSNLTCSVRCTHMDMGKPSKQKVLRLYLAKSDPWEQVRGKAAGDHAEEYQIPGASRVAVTWAAAPVEKRRARKTKAASPTGKQTSIPPQSEE